MKYVATFVNVVRLRVSRKDGAEIREGLGKILLDSTDLEVYLTVFAVDVVLLSSSPR